MSVRYLLIWFVRCYQLTLGPLLRILNGGRGFCRHAPSCSNYAMEALRVHGAWRGTWLILRRLSRCHPWGTCGYDPVPPVEGKPGGQIREEMEMELSSQDGLGQLQE